MPAASLSAASPRAPPVPSPVAPTPSASLATIGLAADDDARFVAVDELDTRTRDLTIESPSVGTVKVRLLLPGWRSLRYSQVVGVRS